MNICETYIPRNEIYNKLATALIACKVIFIGCQTGWGKTITVKKWLEAEEKDYSYASADEDTFWDEINDDEFSKRDIIVLDDLSCISDETDENYIMEYIAKSSSKFIVLSRSRLPSYLKSFFITRQLECFDERNLAFSEEETKTFLNLNNIQISNREFDDLYRDAKGYPLVLSIVLRYLRNEVYSKSVQNKAIKDFWSCMDISVFQRLSMAMQEFLLDISILDKFTISLACMVTGKSNAQKYLSLMAKATSFINFIPPSTYEFVFQQFSEYLRYKLRENFSQEHINQLYQNAGLHYELEGDIINALKYYSIVKNIDKISSLLVENSHNGASSSHFYETGKYYLSIPEKKIMQNPELMSAVSMLYSLQCQNEKSEMWYDRLCAFADNVEKKDSRYKIAKSKIY